MTADRSSLKHWLKSGKAIFLLLPLLIGVATLRSMPGPKATNALLPSAASKTGATGRHLDSSPIGTVPLTVPQSQSATATHPSSTSDATEPRDPFSSIPRKLPNPQSQPSPSPQVNQQPPHPPVPLADQQPEVPLRVAIARGASTLTVGASTPAVVMDAQGNLIGELQAQSAELVQPSASGIQFGPWQAATEVWIKPNSDQGLIYVGDKWYRGAVQLILSKQSLLAVNHLDLESYLYSVVGAEMPASWPLEALKAQAIAARSYAMVHTVRPASQFYDMGSTTRWQAYEGIATETNTTQAAVEATRGLLLSYQGGVVESLYAASDSLVREAHKGFGMSQHGANKLAKQNLNYQQILSHFYPGTRLAWLQATP